MVDERPGQRGTGVVDEGFDAGVPAQSRFNRGQVAGLRQVGHEDVDGSTGFLAQARRERFQPCLVARHQHEAVAAACKALGIDGANAGRCAGDENSGMRGHGVCS
ncbi:hypothetical protein FQZ97_979180 [compost metagenome]